jgi:hypothetical protein
MGWRIRGWGSRGAEERDSVVLCSNHERHVGGFEAPLLGDAVEDYNSKHKPKQSSLLSRCRFVNL